MELPKVEEVACCQAVAQTPPGSVLGLLQLEGLQLLLQWQLVANLSQLQLQHPKPVTTCLGQAAHSLVEELGQFELQVSKRALAPSTLNPTWQMNIPKESSQHCQLL
jgi:hypothetical protein